MSILMPVLPGARVLDLFSGSGALGLEALSRGAEHVVFVERARTSLKALEANIETLDAAAEVTVVNSEALAWLDRLDGPPSFDLALADPPYDRGLARAVVERFAERPFAHHLWVEHRRSESLPDVPGIDQRTYGDTLLSALTAPS